MRLLLDTHVAIWAVSAPGRLPSKIVEVLESSEEVWVSHCSLWELAIKSAPGRKKLPPIPTARAADLFRSAGFSFLEIKEGHIFAVAELPLLHKDPFDRLLVAQALAEPLRLVTHDRKVAAYSDTIISW